MNTNILLKERGKVYGDVRDNMNCAAELNKVIDKYISKQNVGNISNFDWIGVRGCLDIIMHKISRVVTGDIRYEDNWKDIGGYAELARQIVLGEMDSGNLTKQKEGDKFI